VGDLNEIDVVTGVSLSGIRNVRNDIDISYAINPLDVDLHVQQALHRSALVPDDGDVESDTKDGVITLTGHVRTWAEHDPVLMSETWRQGQRPPRPRRAATRHPALVHVRLVSRASRQARRPVS
jgi:hypothetical protein